MPDIEDVEIPGTTWIVGHRPDLSQQYPWAAFDSTSDDHQALFSTSADAQRYIRATVDAATDNQIALRDVLTSLAAPHELREYLAIARTTDGLMIGYPIGGLPDNTIRQLLVDAHNMDHRAASELYAATQEGQANA